MARWFVDRLPEKGIPSVSLRRLLPDAQFVGGSDWEVSGCARDSRRLDPGQVFVAVRGSRYDGHNFVRQALERGAAGVVVEEPCPDAGRLQVIVADSRAAYGRLCQALAGDPSEHLETFGVSGICGRTVTSLFLQSIFEAAGARFGLIGSLGWSDGRRTHPVGSSVPEADRLATMLAEMVERGCAGVVIDLPSEALRLRQAEGIAFDGAVITDLTRAGMSPEQFLERRRAKARLLRNVVAGGAAVVNIDDPEAELLSAVNLDARPVSFALERPADVTARIERLDGRGSRFLLRGFDREVAVELPLIGPRNVVYALGAAALAWSKGLAVDAVVAGLEGVTAVPGRMESVDIGQPFEIRIDASRGAHDLRAALADLRAVTAGRIICVLGAEGHTSRAHRLALAEAAETGAERLVLTTDNPKTEDPDQILDDLLAGLRHPGRARVEPDRQRAIELGLADARPGDALIIAGKGDHSYQIFADHVVPFSDREVALRWLQAHQSPMTRSSA